MENRTCMDCPRTEADGARFAVNQCGVVSPFCTSCALTRAGWLRTGAHEACDPWESTPKRGTVRADLLTSGDAWVPLRADRQEILENLILFPRMA